MPTPLVSKYTGTKRIQRCISPIIGLNGKLAQASVKVKNLPNSSDSGVAYYYGFKRGDRANFALRMKSRNLSLNAYSVMEQTNRTIFIQAIAAAVQIMEDVDSKAAAVARFKSSGIAAGYKSVWTFVFAENYKRIKEQS